MPRKLLEAVQMTQIQQIVKVLAMWMNYFNIPATIQENLSIQQHHPLHKEAKHFLYK